jgi:hypothetical protein
VKSLARKGSATMHTTTLTLVTIVAENVLRDRLIQEVRSAGAKGHTIKDVDGEGSRHRRVGDVLGANIKLETIVSDAVAEKLLDRLAREYFPKFAVIAYTMPVQVVRGEKYV